MGSICLLLFFWLGRPGVDTLWPLGLEIVEDGGLDGVTSRNETSSARQEDLGFTI